MSTNEEIKKSLTKEDIRGAWSFLSMDTGLDENRKTRTDATFILQLLDKHYSAIRDLTPESKKDDESHKRSFMADAGTYEFDGEELVVSHLIAFFPVLGSMTFRCSMENKDTLILEPQYDKMVLPGFEKFKPSKDGKMGYGDMVVRFVFERLE